MEFLSAIFGAIAVWLLCRMIFSAPKPVRKSLSMKESNLLTLTKPLLFIAVPLTKWLIWPSYRRWAKGRIDAAGFRDVIDVEEFFAWRVFLIMAAWLVSMALGEGLRALIFLLAFTFPELWIMSMVQQRHAEIRRTMPYFVDLLSLCTGAGLDFGSAIDRVLAKADEGALSVEFKQARRDVSLGVSQSESLVNLSRRVQMPELTSFVAIIVQALRMGASVSNILEAQAEKMRMERYEKAERIGAQAQQKILLPLLLLILPAFILLGIVPIIIELFRPIMAGGLMGGL